MSMRLIKESPIIQPNDEIVLRLEISRNGQISLQAPTLHPKDVCKTLNALVYDLMYTSFQPVDVQRIEKPGA